ncbi:stealth family protein [Streptomyces vinaceus]
MALGMTTTREEFTRDSPDDVRFPIDLVYTWVDGQDPAWLARRSKLDASAHHREASNAARYLQRDELKYSLRSAFMFLPWVRHIYLVTDRQWPNWLFRSDRVSVIDHTEIFTDPSHLPTFNSHAIESQLHHIKGLSEHFIYLNDDMFIGRPLTPQRFFHPNGLTRFFPSSAQVAMGPPTPADPPTTAAAKNNRRILEEYFGTTLFHKMKHMPYAMRRSVLLEIEETFSEAHQQTAASRFRCPDDISTASSFQQYYSYNMGRAVPGSLSYRYLALDLPDLQERFLRMLHRRDVDAFCLNDGDSRLVEVEAQREVLHKFLDAYYPVAAPWER